MTDKTFVAVVTEGMSTAALDTFLSLLAHIDVEPAFVNRKYREACMVSSVTKAIAHPDFQSQLRAYAASVARAMVPDEEHEGRSDTFPYGFDDTAPGFNRCRADTLSAIDAWEKNV